MNNFTTNTYEMKRDIVNFSKKICKHSDKPETKFVTDMIYGISKSKDILLSSIAESLDEPTKKINVIDRLSDNLSKDLDEQIDKNYCDLVMESFGDNPVFLIDDSDIIKPLGQKFEDLGIVRDGSSKDKTYQKGYHYTEIVGLTKNMKQPVSVFSKIHSSISKEYISANAVTFEGLNKVIGMLEEQKRKGKIKMDIKFQGETKECYVSVLKVQITAQKKWINLVLVYGLGETPMMLASNIAVKNKEDVIKITRCYINRWRIEEYFKFKKQEYNFENFRVRSLKAINNLNKMVTYTIGLLAMLGEKIGKREFVNIIIKESKSLKNKVCLWFYQIARGIYNILLKAKTGIKDWQNIRKQKVYDGQLSLI